MSNAREALRQALLDSLPSLRRYARNLTGTLVDGDDLTQEVCAKALERAEQWDQTRPIRPWLFGMMHNHHVDQRRGDRRRQNYLRLVAADATADTMAGAEPHRGDGRLALRQVADAMAAMSQEHRALLLLVCVEGLSYREAGEALDLPIGTVMSRLSRARRTLADAIDGEGPPTAAAGGEK